MRRTIVRSGMAHCDEEEMAIINLFIAVIKQAKRDLRLPLQIPGSTSNANPTAQEKAEAREFLEKLAPISKQAHIMKADRPHEM